MKFWPDDALLWYENACHMFEYPKNQYGSFLENLIGSEDTVLDLGCGTGAASLLIAPWCRQVIALDQDEGALLQLETRIKQSNITNITLKHSVWPIEENLEADVVVALHVHKALRSYENLSTLYRSVKKGGFIACQAPTTSNDERFAELKQELGIAPKYEQCENGCHAKGVLQGLGATVECQHLTYEFGQPVDTLDEVIRFIAWQTGAKEGSDEVIKKYLDLYVSQTDNRYIVPITRQSCAITFIK